MINRFYCVIAFVGCLACDNYVNNSIPFKEVGTTIEGKWILFERSYSIGGPQVTEQLPVNPPQLIQFHPNHSFTSGISGFSDFIAYDVSHDSIYTFLNLYKHVPASVPDARYGVVFDTDALRLHYVGCIEGCGLAFRRLE